MYDITSRNSFNNIVNWMNEIETHAIDNITKIIVGTKTDLESERTVSFEEG